jgi:hypothetical protein
VVVHPSDIPIRIFHPTIAISNAIFARTLQKSTPSSKFQQQQQQQQQVVYQKKWS